jgi:hypothetical protein
MRDYCCATTTAILVALMMPTTAYSATSIAVGQTAGNFDGAGCRFYIANTEKPKLVRKLSDEGRSGLFEYEHAPGGPTLLLGGIKSGNEWKQVAAMNINGKELLLDWVKQEPVQCLDEVHHNQVECSTNEYADQDVKIVVKRLTSQRACFPDSSPCAGDTASVLVTIVSPPSRLSLVMAGGCGE